MRFLLIESVIYNIIITNIIQDYLLLFDDNRFYLKEYIL